MQVEGLQGSGAPSTSVYWQLQTSFGDAAGLEVQIHGFYRIQDAGHMPLLVLPLHSQVMSRKEAVALWII